MASFSSMQSGIASMLQAQSDGINAVLASATLDGLSIQELQELQHKSQQFKTEASLISETLQVMHDTANEIIDRIST